MLHFVSPVNEDEIELLEVMRKLDDQTNGDALFDDDSILAPLTQSQSSNRKRFSQRIVSSQLNKSTAVEDVAPAKYNESSDETNYFHDSDDDLLNDFSFCFNDDDLR